MSDFLTAVTSMAVSLFCVVVVVQGGKVGEGGLIGHGILVLVDERRENEGRLLRCNQN
jgi:hypothetical protein